MRTLRTVLLVLLYVNLNILTLYAETSVIEKYDMQRMSKVDEDAANGYYNINRIDAGIASNDALIEAFDISDDKIALAFDNKTIAIYDTQMNPVAWYSYDGNTWVGNITIEGNNIRIFFIRYQGCSSINITDDNVKEYIWPSESVRNHAKKELSGQTSKMINGSEYYITSQKLARKNLLKHKYKYLIRVDEKGEKTILYVSNNKHDFEFANITQPIILAGILLANILIIGVRRRRKHE